MGRLGIWPAQRRNPVWADRLRPQESLSSINRITDASW